MEVNDSIKEQIERLNRELAEKSPEEVISAIIDEYGEGVALATSMGAEDQVLTDMLCKTAKNTRIFTIDTGRLFPETYDLISETNKRYDISIEVFFPDYRKVEAMVKEKGINLFYEAVENRKLCCGIRKVDTLKRALSGLDVWICGLRKDQSVDRFYNRMIEWDEANGLIKLNPLINWSEKQVWDYIHKNRVPYNVLHDKGFPSIGCQPCTRAVQPGEDIRAGRWWWEESEKRECGLHRS
ncbi:MAG: phosphoadenylyl-sulfate reductase [Bacteroidota bacterium]